MVNLDFSSLPKTKFGERERIAWRNSIGFKVPFICDDIVGVISIDAYNKGVLTVTYDGFQSIVKTTDFFQGIALRRIIYKKDVKHLIKGTNDFNTKFPHLVKYLVNPVDGENLMWGSNKKVNCKCPTCGFEKQIHLNHLRTNGFSCSQCGDGYSYPSKVMTMLLEYIGIKYIREYMPDWSEGKKYDHYIPSLSMIIEEHGEQHYKDGWKKYEEQHAIDLQKEKMAKENGIIHYIQLDCRKSNINFIRNSINQMNILSFFHINDSDIDWKNIDIVASQTSMLEIVCNEWNLQDNITASIIADKLNISTTTVVRYLKRGVELGLVCYNPKEEIEKARNKNIENAHLRKKHSKSVTQYSLDGIKIKTYESIRKAATIVGTNEVNIINVCKGRYKLAGGFMWRYEELNSIEPYKRKKTPPTNMRAIIQYSLNGVEIATYKSIKDASRELHISDSPIRAVCSGRAKTAGGFIWKYADESKLIA